MNLTKSFLSAFFVFSIFLNTMVTAQNEIPLPEHPRPDFKRTDWINLNGRWDFEFDKENKGEGLNWQAGKSNFSHKILVPFPWGSKFSEVENKADIAWYRRTILIPETWEGSNAHLIFGACDHDTKVWLDGKLLGSHSGGYVPFEFKLPSEVKDGKEHILVVKVKDTHEPYELYGKQGYGDAKGIWQTVYLEKRPDLFIEHVHFTPDIDNKLVKVKVWLNQTAPRKTKVQLSLTNAKVVGPVSNKFPRGKDFVEFSLPISSPRLWWLNDPFLYEAEVSLLLDKSAGDKVNSYFGMRKISMVDFPGRDFKYVALNNLPVYLKLALDQSYHPEGFYTFPSDEFMRDEILRSRRIGLNGQRIHIKVEIPRKLYWADKLGMLIMADVPNSWGEPGPKMKAETEYTLKKMIKRDFNDPSIFSWVLFNETWGLKTNKKYLAETQKWVDSLYFATKKIDPTRLIEDNSPCLYDHVNTDLNTWHAYRAGYEWEDFMKIVNSETFPGSAWNCAKGYKQGNVPMLNSECGNVWGYENSTGDVDWSWDYHLMMNAFKKYPKMAGWLYTEHHDVINEWNGYYKYDRSEKHTGMETLVPGMSLKDLHSDLYVVLGNTLCEEVKAGQNIKVPLWISSQTDANLGKHLFLRSELVYWNKLGQLKNWQTSKVEFAYKPWMNEKMAPIHVSMPNEPGLAILRIYVEDASGRILHRNFTTYRMNGNMQLDQKKHVLTFAPASFSKQEWSVKQWDILDGLKVNGAGSGFFEYEVVLPGNLANKSIDQASLLIELSAKQLFGKDKEGAVAPGGDYMRGKGTFDPSANPNSYPMTDQTHYPSAVKISFNGISAGIFDLKDDPADHRGILSWHSQLKDKKLREAGSYGYLIDCLIPEEALGEAVQQGKLTIRFEVDDSLSGGLAIYGEKFGRYPMNPTIVISTH